MESDILAIVEESRTWSSKVIGAMNATLLALIPKRDNIASFDNVFPISLCDSIYEIILKVIARILKCVYTNLSPKRN